MDHGSKDAPGQAAEACIPYSKNYFRQSGQNMDLRMMGRIGARRQAPVLEAYQITHQELMILLYLRHAGKDKNTSKDIGKLGLFTKGRVSQVLKKLTQQGYVRMEVDDLDRRCWHVLLTEAAQPLVAEAEQYERVLHDDIMAGVTEEEWALFLSVTGKIHANVQRLVQEERIRERREADARAGVDPRQRYKGQLPAHIREQALSKETS